MIKAKLLVPAKWTVHDNNSSFWKYMVTFFTLHVALDILDFHHAFANWNDPWQCGWAWQNVRDVLGLIHYETLIGPGRTTLCYLHSRDMALSHSIENPSESVN
jgi:hypothetical protein